MKMFMKKYLSDCLPLEFLICNHEGIVYHLLKLRNCGNAEQSRDLYIYKL